MNDYREAKCIELHDSNVAIALTKEAYAATCIIGRTDSADKPAFSVELYDIAMLAEMFGVDTSKTVKLSNVSNQRISKDGKESISLLHFPIYKKHFDASGDPSCQILKLECQTVSERMVNIKVTFKWTDFTDSSAEFQEDIEEITYCGSFTIWWKSKNEAIDS